MSDINARPVPSVSRPVPDASSMTAEPAGPGEPGVDASSAGPFAEDAHVVETLRRLLIESLHDHAIYGLTLDGRVATWNAGAERLEGYAAAEIVGQPLSVFYPPEARAADGHAPRAAELLAQAAATGRAEDEGWRVRKDGTPFWALIVLAAVHDAAGRHVGFAKIARDASVRRAADERARELAMVEGAREAAVRAEREARELAERLQEQAIELESQTEEAQSLAEELEQANEQLQQTLVEVEETRARAETARAAAERLQARASFLAEASALLAESLDYEATLARIVQLAVPTLADWAAYNVAEGDYVRTVAIHHPDPAMQRLAREIEERYPQRLDSGAAVAHVLATGEPQLIPEIPDALLRAVARDETHYAQLRSIGLRSLINVPLVARGRVLGNLGFATGESGRRFDASDLAFAEELARRAALALDNARLYEEERRARAHAERGMARLTAMERLGAALSAAVDVGTVARTVVAGVRAVVGAHAAYVARRLPEPDAPDASPEAELVHGEGFPLPLEGGRHRFLLDLPVPGAHVIRTGEALWFASPEARALTFPHLQDSPIARAFAASATLPLVANGQTVGALGLYFAVPHELAPEDRSFLGALSEQVGLALERVRLFEAEGAARAAAVAAQGRAEFLAEASRLLAGSLDYTATLEALTRAAVPRLGDWCAVDIVVDPETGAWPPTVRRLAVAHQDPAKVAWARELERRMPTDWTAPTGLARVLREGATEFLPLITDAMLVAAAAGDAERLAVIREIGFSAYCCVPLRARGRIAGAITLCMTESGRRYDDADRLLAEELAHRASLAIEHAELYRQAQEANAAKSQFLATMSHELRTPLNAIGGYVDLLDMGIRGPVTTEQQQDLDRIRRSQRHLLGLINEILDYARLEAGQTEFEIGEVEVTELVEAMLPLVAPLALAKRQRLNVLPSPPGLRLRGDRERVQQVLVNLLSNAIKFTPDGGAVVLESRAVGDQVTLIVRDTGIGIPADRLASIFEPFVQVQTGLTRQVGGSGLGLAISRDLARQMGGDIAVESAPGVGSTFTLALPRAAS